MVTADPARTPSFIVFANPDYFLAAGAPDCGKPCVAQNPAVAWRHGAIAPEINTTWLGLVGPGVRHAGEDDEIWSDHTDLRPTILSLVGLKDGYPHQGRVLVEALEDWAVPGAVRQHRDTAVWLGRMYKQLNAPVGSLALASLTLSTQALRSGSSQNDAAYTQIEAQLSDIGAQRDALAARMAQLLEGAAFDGRGLDDKDARSLIDQGLALLGRIDDLVTGP